LPVRHGAETKPLCPGGITLTDLFTAAVAGAADSRMQASVVAASVPAGAFLMAR
jgi:hypothetical protein